MRGAPRLGAQLPARARARFTRLRTRIQLRLMVLPKHINAFVPLYSDDFKIRITTYTGPNSTREQLRSDCDSLKNQRGGRRTKPRTVAEHMKDWFLALEIGIDIDFDVQRQNYHLNGPGRSNKFLFIYWTDVISVGLYTMSS